MGISENSSIDNGVETILVVSNVHLSNSDRQVLENADEDFPAFRVIAHRYGWIVPFSTDSEHHKCILSSLISAGLSESFLSLYNRAHDSGCSFLYFDTDGTVFDDMPSYEW